mmetsp:Transcript_73709/g.216323  ORF Transcript_73709/g.216323 Transcript_73709/m.216323 type:complete len:294 (-) Transcript_73709:208-1089(-)
MTCQTASATSWSLMTPQTPSQPRTTAQSSGSSVCTTISGSAITRGRGSFSSMSPKALDVDRKSLCWPFFRATRWMPVFTSWITMPPAFWIRAVSSRRSGLWSSVRRRALRPRMRMARQSPQFATKSFATPPLQPGTDCCVCGASKPCASSTRSAVEPSRRFWALAVWENSWSVRAKASLMAAVMAPSSCASDIDVMPSFCCWTWAAKQPCSAVGSRCDTYSTQLTPPCPSQMPERKPRSYRSLATRRSSLLARPPMRVSTPHSNPGCVMSMGMTSTQASLSGLLSGSCSVMGV